MNNNKNKMINLFEILIKIFILLLLSSSSQQQLFAQKQQQQHLLQTTNINNKLLNRPSSLTISTAERRKAVSIGLMNRLFGRPLTIQVPDVISNLLPSSSNIIKVLSDNNNSTEKIKTDKPTSSSSSSKNQMMNNQYPYLNYDPIKLLDNFDQQQQTSMTKYMPNLSTFYDDSTIGDMNNNAMTMIPLNIMPTQQQQNYMDYGHYHDHHGHHQQQQKLLKKPSSSSSLNRRPNNNHVTLNYVSNDGKNRYVDNNLNPNHQQTSSSMKIGDSSWMDDDHHNVNVGGTKTSNVGFDTNDQSSIDDGQTSNDHHQQTEKSKSKMSEEKMNYFKKIFDSFDDDQNSFGELFSSTPTTSTKQQYHRQQQQQQSQSKDFTNYSSGLKDHPDESLLSHRNNLPTNYYHDTNGIQSIESNNGDERQQNRLNSNSNLLKHSNHHHHQQQDSMMADYGTNYYDNNNNKYLTGSASEIEPIYLPGPIKTIKSDKQPITLPSSMILPMMMLRDTISSSIPDHSIKTNYPRPPLPPVASRVKEFLKNLINTKL